MPKGHVSPQPQGQQANFKYQHWWNSNLLCSQTLTCAKKRQLGGPTSENQHFFLPMTTQNSQAGQHHHQKATTAPNRLHVLQAYGNEVGVDMWILLATAKLMELWIFLCINDTFWPNLKVGSGNDWMSHIFATRSPTAKTQISMLMQITWASHLCQQMALVKGIGCVLIRSQHLFPQCCNAKNHQTANTTTKSPKLALGNCLQSTTYVSRLD